MIRCILAGVAVVLFGLSAVRPAAAMDLCPGPTITITVAALPGSPEDAIARLVAPQLAVSTGRFVQVENVPGASGAYAADAVLSGPADGCSLLLASDNLIIAPLLANQPRYDLITDLAPLAMIGTAPLVVVARPSGQIQTMQASLAIARKTGAMSYGTAGEVSSARLLMSVLARHHHVQLVNLTYTSQEEMVRDLMDGSVKVAIGSIPLLKPYVDRGEVLALASTGFRRANPLPQTPSIVELHLSPTPVVTWWGFLVKSGAPTAVVDRMYREIVAAVSDGKVRADLISMGIDPMTTTSEQFLRFLHRESLIWMRLVRMLDGAI